MDFTYTEEQEILKSSLQRLLQDADSAGSHREIAQSPQGFSPDLWSQFAEMGLCAMAFDEADGGLGATPIETMIVMEEFGRHLVLAPYLASVVLAGAMIRQGGTAAQKSALIPEISAGTKLLTVAFAEADSRFNPAFVSVSARKNGQGYVIEGAKTSVMWASSAEAFFVTARTTGSVAERTGISVFLVDAKAAGVTIESYRTIDGHRAALVRFDNVAVSADALIGELDLGLPLVERVLDEGIAAACAESVGAMKALNEQTVDYCKTRVAFGKPIGKFQAVRHRLVDMFIAEDQCASMAILAVLKLDAAPEQRARTASAAKAKISRNGRFIGQNAIQLHGGIGITDELNVGRYFKRLLANEIVFGDADYHARRFAALTRYAA